MSDSARAPLTLESLFLNFDIVGQIGSGCFGQIFRVSSKSDQSTFALKKVLVDSDRKSVV